MDVKFSSKVSTNNPLALVLHSKHFIYIRTSIACPEQYGVYAKSDNEYVAYIRLRHNHLAVECPDCGGETVFECEYEELYEKGDFDDDNERLTTLSKIDDVLCKYYKKE